MFSGVLRLNPAGVRSRFDRAPSGVARLNPTGVSLLKPTGVFSLGSCAVLLDGILVGVDLN